MAPIKVTLYPVSNIHHVRQVFTGFHALERLGLVALSYSADGTNRLGIAPGNELDREAHCLGADVEGVGLIAYDTHDSDVVNEALLERSQFYFKRSYHPAVHDGLPKVRPLGLNFLIEDKPSLAAAVRAYRFGKGKTKYGDMLRGLGISPPYSAHEKDMAAIPAARPTPKVLFLTRVWKPDGYYGVTPDETRDRTALNDMRADCVRLLREAFGAQFVGGLIPDAFSRDAYPDVVLQDRTMTRKDLYLQSLGDYDVCVSTRGLLGSTGWKFAEYLAKGRAVVSEPMAYTAPGPLEAGRNYLPFTSALQCVDAVRRLFDDPAARQAMMSENRRYYVGFVRPDSLVLNSLSVALSDV